MNILKLALYFKNMNALTWLIHEYLTEGNSFLNLYLQWNNARAYKCIICIKNILNILKETPVCS